MTRVAVTTTQSAYERVATTLRARGLEPVPLPCIEVVPSAEAVLARMRTAADGADWILVTSARAVTETWPTGGMPPVAVAAVGPATAAAVVGAGGRPEVVGHAGAGELVEALAPAVAGRLVVFPRARHTGSATLERLTAAGARVVSEAVYETRPVAPSSEPVEAAVFGSPSAVEGWYAARRLDGVLVGAIGETTAAALALRGRPPDILPSRPSYAALAAALADRLEIRTEARHPS